MEVLFGVEWEKEAGELGVQTVTIFARRCGCEKVPRDILVIDHVASCGRIRLATKTCWIANDRLLFLAARTRLADSTISPKAS